MSRAAKIKPSHATRVTLPHPNRVVYEVELPENSEITIQCAYGFEVCGGRLSRTTYRVWTRRIGKARA
jgi:hypothetical protein